MNAAIGQGYVTVTPLQLARAYVALANGGTLYSPRIGEALIGPGGKVVRRISPAGGRPPAGVQGRRSPTSGTRSADVITQGTGAPAFGGFPLSKLQIAGKTGTAQVQGKVATSVFASFAPLQHPKYVVVMMIPDSGFGADVSGSRGAADLGRDLRAGRPQGRPAQRQAARPAEGDPVRPGHRARGFTGRKR